ncbi:unnamed protein product, partial [Ectocarpus sp. 12 AP-2014]
MLCCRAYHDGVRLQLFSPPSTKSFVNKFRTTLSNFARSRKQIFQGMYLPPYFEQKTKPTPTEVSSPSYKVANNRERPAFRRRYTTNITPLFLRGAGGKLFPPHEPVGESKPCLAIS